MLKELLSYRFVASKVAQGLVLEAVLLISLTNDFVPPPPKKNRKSKIMKFGDSDPVKLYAVIWGSIAKNIMQK